MKRRNMSSEDEAQYRAALRKLDENPFVKQSREDVLSGKFNHVTMAPTRNMLGAHFGLFDDTFDSDDSDASAWEARKTACLVSSSILALSCRGINSSGIVVEFGESECVSFKKILTSTNILEGVSDTSDVEIQVLLPNREQTIARVSEVDYNHNILLLRALIHDLPAVTLSKEFVALDECVTAVGRSSNFDLRASRGKTNIRDDHFECDDLMSSSCTISEWGIGGALVSNSTGQVVGMNFFSKKNATPFMPSVILLHCLKHLLADGEVNRPCIGIKARGLSELKSKDFELIYVKLRLTNGIIVKEVKEGSAADQARICVGHIIISWNDTPLSSPAELADLLFRTDLSRRERLVGAVKKNAESVQVVVQSVTDGTTKMISLIVDNLTQITNSWPLLPYSAKSL